MIAPTAPHPSAEPTAEPIAWASWTLVVLCVAVSGLDFFLGQTLEELGVLHGTKVVAGQWWRPITATFLHYGPIHLFFNMSAVFTLGQALERAVGSGRFVVISIIGALGASAAALAFSFDKKTAGASGMILAWAGALLPIVGRTGRRQLGIMLAQVALISLLPFVSAAGHAGGFLAGLPCGALLRGERKFFWALTPVVLFGVGVALVVFGSGR